MEDPFARFEERRLAREAERQRLALRQRELVAEGEKDAIAVEQLRLLYPGGFGGGPMKSEATIKQESAPPSAAETQAANANSDLMVKDIVLAIVREAHPAGLTASQIRGKAMLRYRRQLNPNTLTVSLVRHSKGPQPSVRCEGRVWYYNKSKANGVHDAQQKSPEVTGLL